MAWVKMGDGGDMYPRLREGGGGPEARAPTG